MEFNSQRNLVGDINMATVPLFGEINMVPVKTLYCWLVRCSLITNECRVRSVRSKSPCNRCRECSINRLLHAKIIHEF